MRNVYVDFGEDSLIGPVQPTGNTIYFDGVSYKDGFIKYGYKCRFLWSEDKDYGYKIFTRNPPSNHPPTEEEVCLVFSLQKLFFENGLSPEPYEIIKCHDDTKEYFAIKMDNIKGKAATGDSVEMKEWVDTLRGFCRDNKISIINGTYRDPVDIGYDKEGSIDPDSSNCMLSDKDNKIYLVDVDIRFRTGSYPERPKWVTRCVSRGSR